MDFFSGMIGRVPGRDSGIQGFARGPAVATIADREEIRGHCRLQGA